MVMTISAYTEPQPVNTAVSEPPQTQETEENAEPSEFAQILAGLLQKTEIDSEALDVPLVDFSDGEVDVLTGEKLNLFGVEPETENVTEKEFSEIEIFEDQMNVFLGAEHLLARSEPTVSDAGIDEGFPQEISNVENAVHLADFDPDADFSLLTDTAEDDSAVQIAAAIPEESLPVESGSKKERVLQKNENTEALRENTRGEEIASLRTAPEKESRGKLDEARNRSRRDKVTFEVRDLRTGTGTEGLKNAEMRLAAGAETASSGRVQGDASVREITLELRLPEGQNSAQTTWEAKAGNALENMLARELHQNFNGDIVRHASMALRDGGEGTIRLALKPESLGNVKIHLEMTENKITGRIVVESEEALNAFRKEIASLEQAFRDSGFANANLNLSLTADGRNTEGQEQEANSWTPRMVASRYDDSFEQDSSSLVDVFFGRIPGSVNMLA